jgi:hypothetical protein
MAACRGLARPGPAPALRPPGRALTAVRHHERPPPPPPRQRHADDQRAVVIATAPAWSRHQARNPADRVPRTDPAARALRRAPRCAGSVRVGRRAYGPRSPTGPGVATEHRGRDRRDPHPRGSASRQQRPRRGRRNAPITIIGFVAAGSADRSRAQTVARSAVLGAAGVGRLRDRHLRADQGPRLAAGGRRWGRWSGSAPP